MEVKNTKTPPLKLQHYFITETQVTANPDITAEMLQDALDFDYDFSADIGIACSEENELQYQVILTIEGREKQDALKGYDIKCQIVGIFLLEPECPPEKRSGLAAVLGPTLLYGALREHIMANTARGPYPAVCLPTISFIPDEASDEAFGEELDEAPGEVKENS